ncbi:ATP-binding cassette domain-containing protein [Peterkaempfera bronchialis]|uniref:ABC transporter ATP-binding protein n=1 Tax=Peterkaempfera bronchialis TaxID=2126346 RepID=UPI003C2DBD07
MIQATGLTMTYRRGRAPALVDLTFDAKPGLVTALLGAKEAGKSTAVRVMLELERGRGATLFGGRPYRSLRRPEREVGVVLEAGRGAGHGGHPGRRARGHLRMLAAAAGVPARRADQLLEQTRLDPVADRRLRTFSPGMARRLCLAAALLGDPTTLLLDAPTRGLSVRNVEWFHAFLRAFATSGGTVLVTCRLPEEAAVLADRVITLDRGRPVADQPVHEFVRSRLRSEVAVRGPQVGRLADLLLARGAEVRREDGAGIAVSGLGRTEIGEIAYRNGILLHELADRVSERTATDRPALLAASTLSTAPSGYAAPAGYAAPPGYARSTAVRSGAATRELPAVPAVPVPVPVGSAASAASAASAVTGVSARERRPQRPPADAEETVVVLSPGAVVAATVAGPPRPDRTLTPVAATPFHGEARPPLRRDPSTSGLRTVGRRPAQPPLPEPTAGADHWSE